MESPTTLEQDLCLLIEGYHRLQQEVTSLRSQLDQQEALVRQVTEQNADLRKSMDVLNADRFVLKRLRDERKVIRRKVTAALNRLESLTQEVGHVPEQ